MVFLGGYFGNGRIYMGYRVRVNCIYTGFRGFLGIRAEGLLCAFDYCAYYPDYMNHAVKTYPNAYSLYIYIARNNLNHYVIDLTVPVFPFPSIPRTSRHHFS